MTMKKLDTHFQCDLCGQFANRGATETNAQTGLETKICFACILAALELIVGGF